MSTPTLRSARVRWTLYAVAGAAVALAIWLSDAPDHDLAVVGAVERPKAAAMLVPTERVVAAGSPVVATLPVERAPATAPAADPFGPPDWLETAELGTPPAPVPIRPLPPPRPSVPPMTFVYLGKWSEGTQTTVFLAHGDHELSLKVGSEIDRIWRVTSIADDRMVLTYLPLKAARTLVFADAVAATTTATAAAPASPDGNEPESN